MAKSRVGWVPFAHLHAHTDASILDGLGQVERTVKAAKEIGFDALAMTDHGTLANAIAFSLACNDHGIKPILGVEGYLSVDGQVGHVTLLADGDEGFHNIVKLNNLGHASSHKMPAFSVDQLMSHSKDVILLTGCVASPLNSMPMTDAVRLGAKLKSVFGHRMFSEVMFIADTDTWSRPLQLSQRLKTKVVITNDAHFPYQQDAEVHRILTMMKAGFSYNDTMLWLRTGLEIVDRAVKFGVDRRIVEDGVKRAFNISQKVRVVNLASTPTLPVLDVANPNKELHRLINDGLMSIDSSSRSEYATRAEYELKIIQKMGYSSYFLILKDIIDEAKRRKVKVGPGRGSGAGSLILYLLGITDVDPIVHDIMFERFLNPYREGMPDVDIDFEQERRPLVLEYATKKWKALPIATYSRLRHKALTNQLGKVLKTPIELTEKASDKGETSEEFKVLCESTPLFKQAYEAMLDQIDHKGKHAGGVVLTPSIIPVERLADDTPAAAWTEGKYNELSYAGVVKFDLLGLSALSVLRRLEERFETAPPPPTRKHPAFKIFRDGDVTGIFQFEGSDGIRQLVMALQPESLDDLAAASALYRPGALDVGATDKYPEWKKKPRRVPSLFAEILKPTYGAIVFQEQVMGIFSAATGGSLGEADLARRVIVKSKVHDEHWREQIRKLQELFVSESMKRGLKGAEAKFWWNELEAHSRYSFNKAHAISYAIISWQMAWWKYNHPAAFYGESLNVDASDAQRIISAAVKGGLKVRPPHINISGNEYAYEENAIYLPLSAIKYLGKPGADAIISARVAGGPFKTYVEFMERVPKKLVRSNAREGIVALGGTKGVSGSPKDWFGKKEVLIDDSWIARQRKYLGFVIPTKGLLEEFEHHAAEGMVSGLIASSKLKESAYGTYRVYYLTPSGSFWSRDVMDLQDGTPVAVQKSSSGRALKIRILSHE